MEPTNSLDQILRLRLATADPSESGQRDPVSNHVPASTMAAELEVRAVARAALAETAGEPVPPPSTERPPVDAELERLEVATDVAEKLGLGFHLGSAVERIAIAAAEGSAGQERLHEATWLIDRYLELIERRPVGADLHVTMSRLAREGDAIAGLRALANALGESRHMPPAALSDRSAALPEPEPELAEPEAPQPEQVQQVVVLPPSFRRELALTGARALIIVAAVVGLFLVLTLIAQWLGKA
jgi:hypothetical protein